MDLNQIDWVDRVWTEWLHLEHLAHREGSWQRGGRADFRHHTKFDTKSSVKEEDVLGMDCLPHPHWRAPVQSPYWVCQRWYVP